MRRFEIRPTKNGLGVVSLVEIESGEEIMPFQGSTFLRNELPVPYDSVEDHYVQIGEDLYMGPSGGMDDYVNHSCDPNAGLIINGRDVKLVAIKPVHPGEEVTWDYSTTMDEDGWELPCECGSKQCRGRIRDFKHLPVEARNRYFELGIVPEYLERFR